MKSLVPAARMLASKRQSAVPIASLYDIVPDPSVAFGIVPMRVVGEEVIQAVGYGDITGPSECVTEYHALSRRTAFLEEFGKTLNAYVTKMIDEEYPRIYLPHPAALEVLTILAARYETNKEASETVRRLGYLCRLLKELHHSPGQQIVVVMTEVIKRHVVTGQNPSKDGHLAALTTWLNPPPGRGTAEEADRAALVPAAAMLTRENDDLVERLLRDAKRDPAQLPHIQAQIEALQRREVEREWETLQRARDAFWNLHLGQTRHELAQKLVDENIDWLRYRLSTPVNRARRFTPMARLHDQHEYRDGIHRAFLVDDDPVRFDQARADGEAFVARVVAVRKTPPRVNPKDHQIDIEIEGQSKVKARQGERVRAINSRIRGTIRTFERTANGYKATLSVGSGEGVNALNAALGITFRWTGALPIDFAPFKGPIHDMVRAALGL